MKLCNIICKFTCINTIFAFVPYYLTDPVKHTVFVLMVKA